MKLLTYQSSVVLKILQRGELYRAKPSISFAGEYKALVDLLSMHCSCPVFCVVKGKKQNTGGKVSGTVQLKLDVPRESVKLTEYAVWADFLYAYKFTIQGNYRVLKAGCGEITAQDYRAILEDLKKQRTLNQYKYPQALLEEIEPKWLVGYKMMGAGGNGGPGERLRQLFRR